MSFYPPKINQRFSDAKNAGKLTDANAVGFGASFVCGSFVRFFLHIDQETKSIAAAKFKTSGCGYAIAAAEVLSEKIVGKNLTELHGLENKDLRKEIEAELELFPGNRAHCLAICFNALHESFADFRTRQISEFAGEKALICTCFSVSEETVEQIIAANETETVEEVTALCRAGGGCGSCRFLIQEMIDIRQMENW